MQPSAPTPPERLAALLRKADYDEALKYLLKRNPSPGIAPNPAIAQLRYACMIADVFDYGGLYAQAESIIKALGRAAEMSLASVRSADDLADDLTAALYLKQQCWALMMWGMCAFRSYDYELAQGRFECARHVLEVLQESKEVSCLGTVSRAWYCIGLTRREQHDYRGAREAFRRSVEFAEKGLTARKLRGEPTVSFDYHVARCHGLGFGWIAYNEAHLDNAFSILTMARRSMQPEGACFIRAFLDVVQGSILVSGARATAEIDEAIGLLQGALAVLRPANGHGNEPYALRVENELALAYMRRARTPDCANPEGDLNRAEEYAQRVEESALGATLTRSRCAAKIARSRILRRRGDFPGALKLAREARSQGLGLPFASIDACIAEGEACYDLGARDRAEYRKALACFDDALKSGGNSPKVAAVCRLHLARTYLANGQTAEARQQFKVWKAMQTGLENSFIANLAEEIRSQLATPDFVLSLDDVGRDPAEKHFTRLRKWLAEAALALERNDPENAGRRLKVDPRTIQRWRGGK